MPDIVDPITRSRMMAGIRGVDTRPEMLVRRYLHRQGFRYRLHDRRLPGRPDLVLPRWCAVVLVQGCFWHAHRGCPLFKFPDTRRGFWEKKLLANRLRDEGNQAALVSSGWRVATVWECALRSESNTRLRRLEQWLRSDQEDSLDLTA